MNESITKDDRPKLFFWAYLLAVCVHIVIVFSFTSGIMKGRITLRMFIILSLVYLSMELGHTINKIGLHGNVFGKERDEEETKDECQHEEKRELHSCGENTLYLCLDCEKVWWKDDE